MYVCFLCSAVHLGLFFEKKLIIRWSKEGRHLEAEFRRNRLTATCPSSKGNEHERDGYTGGNRLIALDPNLDCKVCSREGKKILVWPKVSELFKGKPAHSKKIMT